MKASPGSHPASALFSGFVILAALTITTFGAYGGPCTPPPGGLVGWWKGEGNTLDSISGNSGVNQNINYTNGVDGLAFSCDPENYPYGTYTGIQIADQPAYALTNSLTIEGWVRPRGDGYNIFWRGDNRPGMDPYFLGMSGSNINLWITDKDGNSATVGSPIPYYAWTHVAATLDGSSGNMSIYINGVLAAQTNSPFRPFGQMIPGDSPGVGIGNVNDGGNNFPFIGDIDEISLYSRALSSAEIQAIYNAGNAGKCTNLQSGVPVISSFTPGSGFSGTMLIISGTSFSPAASANIVYFGAVHANVLAASPTNLMVMVPAGATYAPITVNVGGLTAYSAAPFMPTFPGNGSGISTSSFSSPFNLPTLNGPSQTVIADIDGDGKPDIIVVDDYNNSISLFRNISTNATLSAGSFAPRVDLPATGGTYSPFSISVADMDGDGKLDIIATEYGDNLVSVYRNNCTPGNIASNLFTRTDYSTGSGPEGVVARDLDGDGRPDIVVCNGGDGTISILQNTSSNEIVGFAPKVDFAAGGGCQHVAAGDLNGDGKPDLAAVNGDGTLSLFQNQIAGPGVMNTNSFAPAVSLAIPTGGVAVAIVDVDGDGKPDLATTAYLPQIFSVFQNIGTSGKLTIDSFGARMDFPMDGRGHTMAVGDLDGDGKPDLVVDTELNSLINIFRNTSASNSLSLASQIELSTGWNAWGVSVGDLDGDGRPDVVFANSYDSTITIYHNQMPLAVNPPSTNPPAITAIVPNIAVSGAIVIISGTNFSPFAASNIVYFGAVQATVSSSSPTNLVVVVPRSATFAPITVTVGGLTAYSSQLFEPTFTGNGSNITSSSFASSFNLPGANGPQSMVIADLDGDGKPDISFVNGYSHLISIYQNISTNGTILGPGSFAPRLDLSPATNGVIGDSYRLRAFDLDGDGKLDLIVCDVNSDHVSIFHNIAAPGNLTTNSFEAPFTLSASYDTRFATTADLDGDGRVDIVALNYGAKTISIYKNIGTTGTLNTNSFAPPIILAAPGGPYEATIADLDGDGKLDLAVANTDNNTVSIYQSQVVAGTLDTNSFASRVDFPGGVNPETIAAVDLDGDGRLDLVVGSVQSDNVNVYRNLSSGGWLTTNSFAAEVDFDTPGWMHTISVADFNGDGKPDLGVVGELNSYMAIFQNTSTPGSFTVNSFAPRVDFGTGLNAWGIAAGDLDGDGRPDIVFGNYYDNTVQIYQNQVPYGTPLSCTPAASGLVGWWQGEGNANDRAGTNNGSLSGSGATYATGKVGQGFHFDGTNGFMQIPDSAALKPTSVTVEAWVWLDPSLPSGRGGEQIVFKKNTSSAWFEGYSLLKATIDNGDGTYTDRFQFCVSRHGNQVAINSQTIVQRGVWYHVAATYDGNQSILYVNGAAEAAATPGFALDYDTTPVFIGTSGTWAPYLSMFGGIIDEASIYNRALSTNEIVTIYNAGSAGKCSTSVPPPTPPTIISQTPSQVVLLGNTATFSVNVTGSDPLSYFWSRNSVVDPNATNSSYSLLNAQLSDSGSKFSCLVTNAYGSASSTNVSLKVIDTIANDLCSGATIITSASYTNIQSTIKASSFGDPLPDCVDGFGHGVWYQFTAPAAGRLIVDTFGSDFDTGLAIYTGSSDALTEVACNDDTDGVTSQVIIPTAAGTTYFILAGGYGSDAGNLVLHLTHQTLPAFAVEPTNQSVVISNTANFSATLTGALPMSLQWCFNGNPLVDDGRIIGSMTANLSISSLTTADAGSYSLTVTNFLGSANSSNAVLTVLVPPGITLQPIGRSVPPGLPTIFNAAAMGNPTPTYQWQLNGTNIPGATSSSYTNPAIGTNDLGFYHVVASNSVGGAVSSDAQLTFGPVAAWGQNTFNESLPPPGLSDVFAIAGGFGVSFAVRTDGTISEWGGESATNIPSGATNVVAISTPGNTKYALRSDGTVVSWDGISPPAISNIVAIAAGGTSGINFGFALRAEGTLTNWGSIPSPGFPAGLNHVTAIACGNNCALALRSDGTVVVSGTGAITNVPAGLNNVVAIAVGYTYATALKANGTVVAWGSGAGTNLPADMTNIVAISADNSFSENFGLAIRANGLVVGWGSNPYGGANPPDALTNWVTSAVAAASLYHGLALVNDGSPVILHPPVGLTAYTGRNVTLQATAAGAAPLSYQWLLNGTNILGATNTSLFIPNVQLSSAGNYQLFVSNNVNTALSLAAPLTVVSNSTLTFLSQPTSQTNYQGSKATLGVTVLGSGPLRYQWYYSTDNKIFTLVAGATNDSLTFDPAMVANSGYYRVAVSNQFNVATSSSAFQRVLFAKAWGYLAKDPPFDVTNAVAIAVGDAQQGSPFGHYLALKSDGKISSWSGGFSQYGETNVSALSNSFVTAVAAGYQDSLALKSDGTVYAWGYIQYGETNVPSGLNGVTAIACGDYHDLALKSDGTVTGWGQNTYQQTTNVAATNVVAIAAGGSDSMVLRADGTVVTWGGYFGNYLVPSNATNIIAIAAGGQHYLALRANGSVVGWGNNSFGQTTIPAGISNVVAISAGANHSVLLRNDGTVVTLGAYDGQIPAINNTPADLANVTAIASSGDHDLALFGTRAPEFTVQPWNRAVPVNARTNITLAAKCVGVQPMHFQWQLNGTNVPGANSDTLILTNLPLAGGPPIQFIPTGAYQLIASNFYGIAASKYAKITTFYPLATALDTPTDGKGNSLYNWTTSGNAQWFGETNVTHDGVDAAQSGGIGALQETILQTTVGTNWSGSYTFWWKVSSEQDFDILEFRVNGITQTSISGLVDWQPVSVHVAAFTNVLQWRYSKDASFDFGQDAGWVDQFAFIPDPPLIIVQPVSQTVNMGSNVTMQVSAIGPPNSPASPGFPGVLTLRYQWRQNGNPVGGNSPFLNLNNVGRAQNGTYSVTVTNVFVPNNSIVSSNAILKVLVPQFLGSPILLPDGSFQLTSADADGGLLQPSDLANFEAQTSSNLLNWVTLRNALSLTNGMLLLQDSTPSNYPVRFYRLLEH